MRDAGLPYDPPKQYLKVDKARATRIADAFDQMKHDPDDPQVKAAYAALAKETIAQWHAIKATGLKVEWIKPGQDDPYAVTPRLAAMDVTNHNHWWGFPTDMGFGTGAEAETARHNNPMLQMTDEVVDGRRLCVNDVFRIVHDYFGHFKEGVGFRADGEENAWRSHSAMYSELARGAMTSETRGQNSWVNFGPHGEANRTASAADTHYAPQKIGLMPAWTWSEGRVDPPIEREIQETEPAGAGQTAERAGEAPAGMARQEPATVPSGKHFAALASRGAISQPLADRLERDAEESKWPDGFRGKLAAAIADLPQSMRDYYGTETDYDGIPTPGSGHVPLNIAYRASLDEVPEMLRAAYKTAAAVTINHNRTEFFEDRFPDPKTLRHELTHLAWRQLTRGRYQRFSREHGVSPGGKEIDEVVAEQRKIGAAFLEFAKHTRAKETPPAPEGVDPDQWFWLYRQGRTISGRLRMLRRFQKRGDFSSEGLKGSLELSLMIPDSDLLKLGMHLGFDIPDAQNATIALYHGLAERLGIPLTGDFAEEEPVAYKAGADPAFADRLFANLRPKPAQDANWTSLSWDKQAHAPKGGAKGVKGGQFMPAEAKGGKAKEEPAEAKRHPGKGYSTTAYVKSDGRIYTDNVEDAARALSQGRKVELDQVNKVSTLITRLGDMSKEAIAHGEKAKLYDLCDVSVKGSNLFCTESKGIERIKMPQVPKAMTKPFIDWLTKRGYKVELAKVRASHLRATQNQLDGVKVANVARDKMHMDGSTKIKRLVISKDNYILDGHHHWAAKVGLDARDGNLTNDTKMRVARVDIKITKLLELADKFTEGKGKVAAGDAWESPAWDQLVAAADEAEKTPRPENLPPPEELPPSDDEDDEDHSRQPDRDKYAWNDPTGIDIIPPPDHPEHPDNKKRQAEDAEFKEEQHPRDEGGKFTGKGEGVTKKAEEPEAKKAEPAKPQKKFKLTSESLADQDFEGKIDPDDPEGMVYTAPSGTEIKFNHTSDKWTMIHAGGIVSGTGWGKLGDYLEANKDAIHAEAMPIAKPEATTFTKAEADKAVATLKASGFEFSYEGKNLDSYVNKATGAKVYLYNKGVLASHPTVEVTEGTLGKYLYKGADLDKAVVAAQLGGHVPEPAVPAPAPVPSGEEPVGYPTGEGSTAAAKELSQQGFLKKPPTHKGKNLTVYTAPSGAAVEFNFKNLSWVVKNPADHIVAGGEGWADLGSYVKNNPDEIHKKPKQEDPFKGLSATELFGPSKLSTKIAAGGIAIAEHGEQFYPHYKTAQWNNGSAAHFYSGDKDHPTESLIIGTGPLNKGQFALKTPTGVISGQGQEQLNSAFEQVHPRGPGGKFAKKPELENGGEDESPTKDDFAAVNKWIVDSGLKSADSGELSSGERRYQDAQGNILRFDDYGAWAIYPPLSVSSAKLASGSGFNTMMDAAEQHLNQAVETATTPAEEETAGAKFHKNFATGLKSAGFEKMQAWGSQDATYRKGDIKVRLYTSGKYASDPVVQVMKNNKPLYQGNDWVSAFTTIKTGEPFKPLSKPSKKIAAGGLSIPEYGEELYPGPKESADLLGEKATMFSRPGEAETNEEVLLLGTGLGNSGDWQIKNYKTGITKTGHGQTTLNNAFAELHPPPGALPPSELPEPPEPSPPPEKSIAEAFPKLHTNLTALGYKPHSLALGYGEQYEAPNGGYVHFKPNGAVRILDTDGHVLYSATAPDYSEIMAHARDMVDPEAYPTKEMREQTYRAWAKAQLRAEGEAKSALVDYTGGASSEINSQLRHNEGEPGEYSEPVSHLDDLMKQDKLPEDAIVYRGIGGEFARNLRSVLGVGAKIFDRGFASTSISRQTAKSFGKDLMMEIHLKKGQHGVVVGSDGSPNYAREQEVLLPRGTQYEITAYNPRTGMVQATIHQAHLGMDAMLADLVWQSPQWSELSRHALERFWR
jgi:hypothetical protein